MRGGGRGSCGVSANEFNCTHGAQINFGDLTPYLTYGPTWLERLTYTFVVCLVRKFAKTIMKTNYCSMLGEFRLISYKFLAADSGVIWPCLTYNFSVGLNDLRPNS
jgi:hypothetical protein